MIFWNLAHYSVESNERIFSWVYRKIDNISALIKVSTDDVALTIIFPPDKGVNINNKFPRSRNCCLCHPFGGLSASVTALYSEFCNVLFCPQRPPRITELHVIIFQLDLFPFSFHFSTLLCHMTLYYTAPSPHCLRL